MSSEDIQVRFDPRGDEPGLALYHKTHWRHLAWLSVGSGTPLLTVNKRVAAEAGIEIVHI